MSTTRAPNAEHVALSPAAGEIGATSVSSWLARHGWHFQLVLHKPTFRSVDEATASGVPPHHAVKTLLLHGRRGYLIAAIPASERLDLHKVRSVADDRQLRLATESEMETAFPRLDVGALPPIGPLLGVPSILDRRLLGYSRLVCSGGDHQHAIVLIPLELERRSHPIVADLCED